MIFYNSNEKGLLHPINIIGIDVNKDRIVCSDGRVFRVRHFNEELGIPDKKKELQGLDKDSKAYTVMNLEIGKLCRKAQKMREAFYLNLIPQIVTPGTEAVCVETLDINKMAEEGTNKLKEDLFDIGFGIFLKEISRHCKSQNIIFCRISTYAPSSKTCSMCGFKYDELGAKKEWICPKCKIHHDRDLNASLMIKKISIKELEKRGFKMYYLTPCTINVPDGGFEACDVAIDASTERVIAFDEAFRESVFEKTATLYEDKEAVKKNKFFSKLSLLEAVELFGFRRMHPTPIIGDIYPGLRQALMALGYQFEYYITPEETPTPNAYFIKKGNNVFEK